MCTYPVYVPTLHTSHTYHNTPHTCIYIQHTHTQAVEGLAYCQKHSFGSCYGRDLWSSPGQGRALQRVTQGWQTQTGHLVAPSLVHEPRAHLVNNHNGVHSFPGAFLQSAAVWRWHQPMAGSLALQSPFLLSGYLRWKAEAFLKVLKGDINSLMEGIGAISSSHHLDWVPFPLRALEGAEIIDIFKIFLKP